MSKLSLLAGIAIGAGIGLAIYYLKPEVRRETNEEGKVTGFGLATKAGDVDFSKTAEGKTGVRLTKKNFATGEVEKETDLTEQVGGMITRAKEAVSEKAEDVKKSVGKVIDDLKHRASDAAEETGEAAEDLGEKLEAAAEEAEKAVEEAAEDAAEKAEDLAEDLSE